MPKDFEILLTEKQVEALKNAKNTKVSEQILKDLETKKKGEVLK